MQEHLGLSGVCDLNALALSRQEVGFEFLEHAGSGCLGVVGVQEIVQMQGRQRDGVQRAVLRLELLPEILELDILGRQGGQNLV